MFVDAGGYIHPFVIDGDGDKAAACGGKNTALQAIAGVFNPDCISGIEEDSRGDVERLLRAGDDHDLVCVALYSARGAEIAADRFADAL
jgi:hypothetical protein